MTQDERITALEQKIAALEGEDRAQGDNTAEARRVFPETMSENAVAFLERFFTKEVEKRNTFNTIKDRTFFPTYTPTVREDDNDHEFFELIDTGYFREGEMFRLPPGADAEFRCTYKTVFLFKAWKKANGLI